MRRNSPRFDSKTKTTLRSTTPTADNAGLEALQVQCRVARGSKFQDPTRPGPRKSWPDPTRPANISGFLDPTRPDPMTIHDGQKGFIIARCTLSSAYTQVTSSTKSASTLRTYQIHDPSVRTHRDLHAVAALYQLLPETLHCDDWVPTNMYARNVRGVAVELSLMIRPWSCNKKVIVKQQLVYNSLSTILYKCSRQRQSLWLP